MSQIQPIICFKIFFKELSDSDFFASRGRLFHSEAPPPPPTPYHLALLAKIFLGIGSAKSVWVFLKL